MIAPRVVRKLGVLFLSAALTAAAGCQRGGADGKTWEIISFRATQNDLDPGGSEVFFDEKTLRKKLSRALAPVKRLSVLTFGRKPKDPSRAFIFQLIIYSARSAPSPVVSGGVDAVVQLEIRLLRTSDGTDETAASAEAEGTFAVPAEASDHERHEAFVTALGRAMEAALQQLVPQLEDMDLTTRELGEALASPSFERRSRALRALDGRDPKDAMEGLLRLVANEREPSELVLQAAGILSGSGSSAAVPVLIDAAERMETTGEKVTLMAALGQLGGEMAEGYLFTLAGGHPDADIRRAARAQLQEMGAQAGLGLLADDDGTGSSIESDEDDEGVED